MSRGVWYAVLAYGAWGLFPVYWKWLRAVPAPQLLSHRVLWSCVLLMAIILVQRDWRGFVAAASKPRVIGIYSLAGVLLGVNWLTYVWAVNAGFVVETSLGYFINPLISILFAVVLLHERLRAVQWTAIAIAASGVAYLTYTYGALPWIALTLAVTFALYGLVKKVAPLGSVHGLGLETALMLLPSAAWLLYSESVGKGAFLHSGVRTDLLLVGAGVVTTVPLLFFASAAKRIPLAWLGVLQYIAPILQFLLGVFVYGETLTAQRLIGFSLVWLALIVFGVEGFVVRGAAQLPPTAE